MSPVWKLSGKMAIGGPPGPRGLFRNRDRGVPACRGRAGRSRRSLPPGAAQVSDRWHASGDGGRAQSRRRHESAERGRPATGGGVRSAGAPGRRDHHDREHLPGPGSQGCGAGGSRQPDAGPALGRSGTPQPARADVWHGDVRSGRAASDRRGERGLLRGARPGRIVTDSTRSGQENGRPRRPFRDGLTIEQAAAIESPREFRVSPDGRRVAYTAEGAGARQIYLMSIRGGYPEQLTATEKPASDPQWSPDGRRIAFVREDSIWMIDVEGSHQALVTQHPSGNRSPRWCADGHQIAFISRRRGWDQVWLTDALGPGRGRPATKPRSAEPTALTAPGVDIDEFVWSPNGQSIAVTSQRLPDLLTSQIHIVDVASGRERLVAGGSAWETAPRWLPDGSGLLMVSDQSGWFQVARVSADGSGRRLLTSGQHEHGEPGGSWGYAPVPSPDGCRFVHVEVREGLVDLLVGELPDRAAGIAPSRRSRRSSQGVGNAGSPIASSVALAEPPDGL